MSQPKAKIQKELLNKINNANVNDRKALDEIFNEIFMSNNAFALENLFKHCFKKQAFKKKMKNAQTKESSIGIFFSKLSSAYYYELCEVLISFKIKLDPKLFLEILNTILSTLSVELIKTGSIDKNHITFLHSLMKYATMLAIPIDLNCSLTCKESILNLVLRQLDSLKLKKDNTKDNIFEFFKLFFSVVKISNVEFEVILKEIFNALENYLELQYIDAQFERTIQNTIPFIINLISLAKANQIPFNLNWQCHDGNTPLSLALKCDQKELQEFSDLKSLKEGSLLQILAQTGCDPNLPNIVYGSPKPLLIDAIQNGRYEEALFLVKLGAKITIQNTAQFSHENLSPIIQVTGSLGFTPLMLIITKETSPRTIKLLTEMLKNVTLDDLLQSRSGRNIVELAVEFSKPSHLILVLKKGGKPLALQSVPALIRAIERLGNIKDASLIAETKIIISILIKAGVPINVAYRGKPPIDYAAECGLTDIVNLLKENGAKSDHSASLLYKFQLDQKRAMETSMSAKGESLSEIIKKGANQNVIMDYLKTHPANYGRENEINPLQALHEALYFAVANKDNASCELLMEWGADPKICSTHLKWNPPSINGIQLNSEELLSFLKPIEIEKSKTLALPISKNKPDHKQQATLQNQLKKAIEQDDKKLVLDLIMQGVNLNDIVLLNFDINLLKSNLGDYVVLTPLQWACHCGNPKMFNLLVNLGADFKVANEAFIKVYKYPMKDRISFPKHEHSLLIALIDREEEKQKTVYSYS